MQTGSYQRMETDESRRWCGCTFKPVEKVWEGTQWKRTLERYIFGAHFFVVGGLSHILAYILEKDAGEHITYLAYSVKSVAIPIFFFVAFSAQYIDSRKARDFTKEVGLDICTALVIETLVTIGREVVDSARGPMIAAEVISTFTVTCLFIKTVATYKPTNVTIRF